MKKAKWIVVFIAFVALQKGQAQTFDFECYGGYLTGTDCQICTGQTTARLFNGLIVRRGGVVQKLIDCPYFIRQQGSNLVITELIPNPESITINLLSSGFSTITGFRDSVACMCARQDSSWIGGGGGTYYQTFEKDGTALTQQPTANFTTSPDIDWTLTNDGANSETDVQADIKVNAVDYAEIQQVSANRLLGNPTGSTANVAEIPIATGLFFSGGNLNVADRDSLNEAWTIDADDSDLEVISSQIVKFEGAGINTTDYVPASNTLIITGTEVDGSTINELQTIANTSDATSHTVTLSNSGGSVQIIEGTGIGLATGGTTSDGTLTVTNTAPDQTVSITGGGINNVTGTYPNFTVTGTEVDGSITNENLTISDGTDSENLGGQTLNVVATGIATVDYIPGTNTLSIGAIEADGSTTNEAWTVDADGGATEVISSQTVLFSGAGINATSYDAGTNTLTVTGTEVDGSTSNELQTLANSSDATSHTATLSNSGGSVQIIEGTGVGLSTGGTGLNGTVTVTNTAPDQTVSITGGGVNVVTGTYPNFTVTGTEVDGSTTNEAWTIDGDGGATEVISSQTVLFSGAGINSTSYDAGTNTLTVTGTEADGSVSNEGVLGVGAGGSNDADLTTTTSLGNPVNFAGGGIVNITETTSANGGTINVTATEVDGSTTNELQTYGHSGTTSYTNTLSNSGGSFTLQSGGIVSLSHTAGTTTISATEVDGSTTNELQAIANSSDATSHTVTLSNSGGSVQLIEGANITLTTGGTSGAGTVTIAATGGAANYQTVRDDGADETQRAALNFVSTSTVNAVGTDDAGNNETEIALNVPTDGITATEIAAGAVGTSEIATNAVANADFRQSAALSVVGRSANSTGDVADITAASDFQVLRRSGTTVGFGSINLASTNAVTSTLPVGNGGTGIATLTANRIPYGNGTSAFQSSANLTFDGTTLTANSRRSTSGTESVSTSVTTDNVQSILTGTANSLTLRGSRLDSRHNNSGSVTGNSLYGVDNSVLFGNTNAATAGAGLGINNYVQSYSPNITGVTGFYTRVDERSASGNLASRIGARIDLNKFVLDSDGHTGVGLQGQVADQTANGRWNSGTGLLFSATNCLTGYGVNATITNQRGTGNTQYGVYLNNNASGASTTVSNAYGVFLSTSAGTSGNITNYYALYNATSPAGATQAYFLYSSSATNKNYLAGNTGIGSGITTPARTLHVGGEARITDLDTDPATRIVGADADGDLDAVLLTDELAITSGTLGTNFSTTITPAQVTSNQTTYNPTGAATAWIWALSADDGFRIIRTITAPAFNKRLTLMNVGSNAILLTNQDNFSGTTAANRFDFGRDVVLFPGKSLDILYNTTAARWKLVSNGLYDDVEQVYFNERLNAPVSGSSGDYSFWDFVSENGIGGIAPVAGRFAGISVNTGSNPAGLGYVAAKDVFFENTNAAGTANWAYCKAVVKTPSTLSDASNDYTIRVGFADATGGGGANDGFYFDYNHANVSGNWGCNTTNAGNTQRNNSGITVATSTVYVLEAVFRPDLTAEYYINGTRVATNSSFVPGGTSDDMKVLAEIQKSVGTAQRDLQVFTIQTSIAFVR